jgi:NAD(P)-dependent dehydrogenase (short-subunit alcohol dehydrogenase family)
MRELKDRVSVVTGAANGIGRAVALELARAGMHVVLADVDEAGMQSTASEVQALGRRAACVRTDVRERHALERLLERTLSELGSCHVAVNNAGVFHAASLLGAPDEQWERVIGVNLWGVIHGSRVFGTHFVAQGEGHIVNTGSAAGLMPAPGMSSYSTSKYAVVGFSRQLRWELARSGVGVTVVCPGVVKTGIGKAPGAGLEHIDVDAMVRRSPSPEGLARKVLRAIQRNRPMVLYGIDAYLAYMARVLPLWLLDVIGSVLARGTLGAIGAGPMKPKVQQNARDSK